MADHPAHGLAAEPLRLERGMALLDPTHVLREERQLLELLERDQPRAQSIVDVVVVVRDLVGEVRELRLEARLAALEEAFADVAELARVLERAVLQDSLARLEGEVQPAEARVALLELVDHAQRLQVVLEAAELAHAIVERVLPRVAERRVAEVVREADRFDEVLVQRQRARDGARDLRDLERMRETRAIEVALVVHEHLGLVDEAAERGRMDHAVAVALELGAIRRRIFGVAPARARSTNAPRTARARGRTRAARIIETRPRSPRAARTIRGRRDDRAAELLDQDQLHALAVGLLVELHAIEHARPGRRRRRGRQPRAREQRLDALALARRRSNPWPQTCARRAPMPSATASPCSQRS